MMKLLNPITFAFIASILILFASCKNDDNLVVDYDCGEVETEITDLSHRLGSYTSSTFTNSNSSNFEEAAIAITIDDLRIITETETSCATYTALPQLIEKISITSSNSVTSGGVEFSPDENLNELFKLHNKEETYSVSSFISAQNNEPLIFHSEDDKVVLQVLNQPDTSINQSFAIQITFDDAKILNVEVPAFEVTN